MQSRRLLVATLTIATLALTGPVVGAAHAKQTELQMKKYVTCLKAELHKPHEGYTLTAKQLKVLDEILDSQALERPPTELPVEEQRKVSEQMEAEITKRLPDLSTKTRAKIKADLELVAPQCSSDAFG
ncbi:hypothetical protein [Nocardia sp. NPDC050175]|uniref:hypothetical protein n=1 Tax=Nocardia sp. NPDC050175 TaxID=3364317 RepID=UPI0037ABE7B8